ncbi:hypothetical protein D2E26_1350 [Bifidobacterium dolichotidis]|uniref:Uncharacterized protein n=1 Tax=Bifidobacterium dolichotidis TaxID=2306976 RepID=A0A430FNY2_9BIFI|nr:hypothetical protein [Bifidobacterium dolichotidis]RSX54550.1 hypothetical protein D2E26_1350 [Bifidobacterium dolichotidis]
MTFPNGSMPLGDGPDSEKSAPVQTPMPQTSQQNSTPQQAAAPQQESATQSVKKSKSALAIVGLILGAVGLALSWIPVINLIGVA